MIGLSRSVATDAFARTIAIAISQSKSTMILEFLNPSRSFDEVRKAIRFLGHDGMFEVPFLSKVEVLATIGPC
ncbi:hypothetical protein [Mesorhizobium marinum]|uniref:hypothetical protein n=1 Tax=Mesorhizobium marinum TaxID=3228790 RepID=UPI003F5B8E10